MKRSVSWQLVTDNNPAILTLPYFQELLLPGGLFLESSFFICVMTHLNYKEIFLVYICKAQLSFRCSSVKCYYAANGIFCSKMLPLDTAFISLLFQRHHRLILIYEINTFCALENGRRVYLCVSIYMHHLLLFCMD